MKNANITKIILSFIGISGCFSVLFGAWLAHGANMFAIDVQSRLAHALQYQFIHTLALCFTLTLILYRPSKWLSAASVFFMPGILAFSGSLYLKTFFDFSSFTFLSSGKLTPYGGISFALGWLMLVFASKNLLGKNSL